MVSSVSSSLWFKFALLRSLWVHAGCDQEESQKILEGRFNPMIFKKQSITESFGTSSNTDNNSVNGYTTSNYDHSGMIKQQQSGNSSVSQNLSSISQNPSSMSQKIASIQYRCPVCRGSDRNARHLRALEQLMIIDRWNCLSFPVPRTCLNYWRVVKRPMNFSEMKVKVYRNDYKNNDDSFMTDFALIIHNAKVRRFSLFLTILVKNLLRLNVFI